VIDDQNRGGVRCYRIFLFGEDLLRKHHRARLRGQLPHLGHKGGRSGSAAPLLSVGSMAERRKPSYRFVTLLDTRDLPTLN